MNSNAFTHKKTLVTILRNATVFFGVAAIPCFILAVMPSPYKALYWSLTAVFAFLCVGLGIATTILGEKWDLTAVSAYKKANFWTYFALIVTALIFLIPFYVLIVTSVKTIAEANDAYFTWWPTQGFQFESISRAFTDDAMGITILQSFGNTLLYCFPTTVVCVFVSSLSAYAFSKLYFPGRNTVFAFLIFTMMIPGCSMMTSSYLMFSEVHLTGTPWPLILPGLFGSVTMIFFMREYFSAIPDELLEAAKVEGAGKMRIFFSIVFPLGLPVIFAQFILNFVTRYNDYTGPLIYLKWPEEYTLQLFLTQFNASSLDNSVVAASCIVSILPLLAIYLAFQKQILKGVSMSSGLKG